MHKTLKNIHTYPTPQNQKWHVPLDVPRGLKYTQPQQNIQHKTNNQSNNIKQSNKHL